jgi:hypothetical protein
VIGAVFVCVFVEGLFVGGKSVICGHCVTCVVKVVFGVFVIKCTQDAQGLDG